MYINKYTFLLTAVLSGPTKAILKSIIKKKLLCTIREDTHKKVFFCGRTTKQISTLFHQIKKFKKKYEPLRSRGGGTQTLVVRPLEKHFFMCVFPCP